VLRLVDSEYNWVSDAAFFEVRAAAGQGH
jgi:hypothetical protein